MNETQPLNAAAPILSSDSGSSIAASDEQPSNALAPIDEMAPKSAFVSAVQFRNALAPIVVDPPTETVLSVVLFLNAFAPMETSFFPSSVTEVIVALPLKASTAIAVTFAGMTRSSGIGPLNPITVVPEES